MLDITSQSSRSAAAGRRTGGGGRVLSAGLLACALLASGQASAGDLGLSGNQAGGAYTLQVRSWRDIPFRSVVRQQYDFSCGSAAVATLLRYHYGRDVNETQAFRSMYEQGDQAKIRAVGFSMLDMKRYLESVGYRADGFRISLDRLAQMHVPAIALITRQGYKHFVVIKGVRGDKVLLGDPSRGLEIHTRAEFESWWNGIALAVRAGPGSGADLSFNRDDEWRPWASAPTDTIGDRNHPGNLTLDLPMLYQISRISVINGGGQ